MFQRRIQIGDLDGCLSDDRWRRGLIRPEPRDRGADWPDKFAVYHEACFKDSCANREHLLEGTDLVILTGRPLKYRAMTMAWLAEVAGLDPLHVIFRNDGDHRHSHEVKRDQLRWLLGNYGVRKEQIILAIDDMEPIVQMYRSEGLKAQIVRIGAEEHAHG